MLIKNKKILSVFNCFWKVFCFCKMSKISKTLLPCFGDSVVGWSNRMSQSHVPVASPHRDFSWLTGWLMPRSQKILRMFFKIWFFNVSRNSVWQLVRGWKVQLQKDSKIFVAYLVTLSRVELPVAKNR